MAKRLSTSDVAITTGFSESLGKLTGQFNRPDGVDLWSKPRCFLIHAWTPTGWKHVVSHIRKALEKNFSVDVDLDFGANESIRDQVLDRIRSASLVVCLLDDLAPNVVFEYGFAMALGKSCIPMVRKDAVVNIKRFFADPPSRLENPELNINKHFSDIRDIVYCPYDHEEPADPKRILAEELAKRAGLHGKSLGGRVLDTWILLLRSDLGDNAPCFDQAFDYIAKSKIDLDKQLFATRRKRTSDTHLEDAIAAVKNQAAEAKEQNAAPIPLPTPVIEAIDSLAPEHKLATIESFLSYYPDDRRLLFGRTLASAVLAYEAECKNEERNKVARSHHENYLKRFKNDITVLGNYAILLTQLGNVTQAIELWGEIIDNSNASTENKVVAYFNRGLAKGHFADYRGVIRDQTAVIDMSDASSIHKVWSYVSRGIAKSESGDMKGAIEDYTVVIDMPDDPAELKVWAYGNRGVARTRLGDTVGAMGDYTAIINMLNTPAEQKAMAYNSRGDIKHKSGDTAGAILEYSTVIGMPDIPAEQKAMAYINRGVAKGETGNNEGEIQDCTAAIDTPNAPMELRARAYINRGVSRRKCGDSEGEMRDCTSVIEMPGAPVELKAKAHINRGVARGRSGDPRGKIEDCQSVIEMSDAPSDLKAFAHSNLGWVYYQGELLRESIAEYRKALKLDADYINARSNLGLALITSDHADKGLSEYGTLIATASDADELESAAVDDLKNAIEKYPDIPEFKTALDMVQARIDELRGS